MEGKEDKTLHSSWMLSCHATLLEKKVVTPLFFLHTIHAVSTWHVIAGTLKQNVVFDDQMYCDFIKFVIFSEVARNLLLLALYP